MLSNSLHIPHRLQPRPSHWAQQHTHAHTNSNARSPFFADGHIMHNQPNKTADFSTECWTPSPLEGILGGHCLLEAVRCKLDAVSQQQPQPIPNLPLTQPSTSPKNWSEGKLACLKQCSGIAERYGATHILGDYTPQILQYTIKISCSHFFLPL